MYENGVGQFSDISVHWAVYWWYFSKLLHKYFLDRDVGSVLEN